MKARICILLFLTATLSIRAQNDTLNLGICTIIDLDSINFCSSHFAIKFLTDIDTFHTVVDKSLIRELQCDIRGKSFSLTAEIIDSLQLTINGSLRTLDLKIFPFITHMSRPQYVNSSFIWKEKTGLFRKTEVSVPTDGMYLETYDKPICLAVSNLTYEASNKDE